ncbi:hypothetical protein BGZ95_005043, partial [Linnemannia exigua]
MPSYLTVPPSIPRLWIAFRDVPSDFPPRGRNATSLGRRDVFADQRAKTALIHLQGLLRNLDKTLNEYKGLVLVAKSEASVSMMKNWFGSPPPRKQNRCIGKEILRLRKKLLVVQSLHSTSEAYDRIKPSDKPFQRRASLLALK